MGHFLCNLRTNICKVATCNAVTRMLAMGLALPLHQSQLIMYWLTNRRLLFILLLYFWYIFIIMYVLIVVTNYITPYLCYTLLLVKIGSDSWQDQYYIQFKASHSFVKICCQNLDMTVTFESKQRPKSWQKRHHIQPTCNHHIVKIETIILTEMTPNNSFKRQSLYILDMSQNLDKKDTACNWQTAIFV